MSSAAPLPRLLVNGAATDRVSARDRGFTLGDGLFETIAVRDGRVRCWTEHCQRLLDGCRRLGLPSPDPEDLWRQLEQCRDDEADGMLRLTWTRGPGARGYAIPATVEPTCVIAWFAGLPDRPERPLRVRWCETRLGENPALAGMKHLNRLEQVLARAEWSDEATDEGLMRSTGGDVIECTASNLFLVSGGELRTPDLTNCGVGGVIRRRVLELAAGQAMPVRIDRITVDDVLAADELFVTNASRGIAPVGRLDDRQWRAPGPHTRALQAALEASFR